MTAFLGYLLVIAGILLSYGHQSSLGGLFLITPDRLHSLWSTPMLHTLFFRFGDMRLFLFEFSICAVLPMIFLAAKTIRISFP